MTDEIKAEVASWLQALRHEAGGAKAFLLEQAPQVLREVVLVGRIYYTAAAVGWALVAVWLSRGWERMKADPKNREPEGGELKTEVSHTGCIFTVLELLAWAGALYSAYHASVTWLAPRLYILEYLASLAK